MSPSDNIMAAPAQSGGHEPLELQISIPEKAAVRALSQKSIVTASITTDGLEALVPDSGHLRHLTDLGSATTKPQRFSRSLFGFGPKATDFETENRRYSISPRKPEGLRDVEEFSTSAEARVLLHHAMTQSRDVGDVVDVVAVSLPLFTWLSSADGGGNWLSSIEANLTEAVGAKGRVHGVESVETFPGTVSAIFDPEIGYRLDDGITDPVAIVDIGMDSTIVATLEAGFAIDHDRSRQINFGMRHIVQTLQQAVSRKHDLPKSLGDEAFHRALRTGSIKLYGSTQSVREEIDLITGAVSDALAEALNEILQDVSTLDGIHIIGCGAPYLPQMAELAPHVRVHREPSIAALRGLRHYIEQRENANVRSTAA